MSRCLDCRAGEHSNYDEDVRLTAVRDPETGRTVMRANLCAEHRAMYAADGYVIEETGP